MQGYGRDNFSMTGLGTWAQILLVVATFTFFPGIPPYLQFETFSVEFQPLTEELSINDKLDHAEKLFENEVKGPEDFAVYNNEIYTSTHGGYIQKITKNGDLLPVVKFGEPCEGIWQEHICGRPLGIKITPDGILYAADAYYGLKKVNLSSGDVESLVDMTTPIDGIPPTVPNSLVISTKGLIYWTDSSTSHKLHDGLISLLGNGNGRVLVYDPKTKKNTVLMKDLHFPNGIALSEDESFLIIAETFRARLLRYHLVGSHTGKTDVFVDHLPGFPDNILLNKKGNIIVSLILPSDTLFSYLAKMPYVRKLAARILTLIQNMVKTVNNVQQHVVMDKFIHFIGHFEMMNLPFTSPGRVTIVAVNKHGTVVDSLHSTDGKISHICSIVELDGYYYLGSPFNSYVARVPISKLQMRGNSLLTDKN